MKNKFALLFLGFLVLALSLNSRAQTAAFTYQGFLTDQGAPANASYDLTFTLFDSALVGNVIGTSNVVNDLAISNGLFAVTLNYGASAFPGADRWLQIAVRPGASTGDYTNVTPRQQITSAPYAIRAANFSGVISNTQLSGVYAGAVTFSNSADIFRGAFIGNGVNVSNVNAVTLSGITAAGFWQLDGNDVANGQILGSTNNRALQFVVNGFNALRLEPNAAASPNLIGGNGNGVVGVNSAVIGGGFANSIETNANQGFIGGGGFNDIGPDSFSSSIVGGANNKILSNSANTVIAGGESNLIDTNCSYAFIGGGGQNHIFGNDTYSFLGGGNANLIQIGANFGFIGGGRFNTNSATTSVIAGGEGNAVQALADRSFIGGGLRNITTGALGMVPGGFANVAGSQAFAAGRRAKANDAGSFVWADSTDADFASSLQNQVNMRASGGYRLFSNTGATIGVQLVSGGNAWAVVSDRTMKENFQPVDCRTLLEKVVTLPVTTWNLKSQSPDIRHIGAMAQDFQAAFAVGEDDRHISTSDADGVTLAAIQGLNQKVEEQRAELKQKETEITELQQRLDALEKTIRNLKSN